MRCTPSFNRERWRVSRDDSGTMPISARPMQPRPSEAFRTPARRSSSSDSPSGRAIPNLSPEPVGSAVVTTTHIGRTVVPGGVSGDVTGPPIDSIFVRSSAVGVYNLPSFAIANGTSPRSRLVDVKTVASRFGRLTSALASRTTLPSRSTLTSSRPPENAVRRRVGAVSVEAVVVAAAAADAAARAAGAGPGAAAGAPVCAARLAVRRRAAAASATSRALASAARCASVTFFWTSAALIWMPCTMPSIRWLTSPITR